MTTTTETPKNTKTKVYPHGTAIKVAKYLGFSPQYVRDVLAGKAHNEKILDKALEIAASLKEERAKLQEKRKKIANITTELKTGVQEQAEQLAKSILT